MKKIALTSLLAVFAAAGANAANTFDGNPLYMPQSGHFYSETALSTHTNNMNGVTLAEEFGYGITDRLAISVNTSASESNWFKGNKEAENAQMQEETYPLVGDAWNNLDADVAWRVINDKAWKLDVSGGFEVGAIPFNTLYMTEGEYATIGSVWGDHAKFMDKDNTFYTWKVDVRGGYVTEDWTLAAHAGMLYVNTEAFNWGDNDPMWANHIMNLGVAGHWTMSDTWSAYASADYYKIMDHYNEVDTRGYWDLTLGLNLNIDDTKYVGAYATRTMYRANGGYLDVQGAYAPITDGFTVGAKFGIDF